MGTAATSGSSGPEAAVSKSFRVETTSENMGIETFLNRVRCCSFDLLTLAQFKMPNNLGNSACCKPHFRSLLERLAICCQF